MGEIYWGKKTVKKTGEEAGETSDHSADLACEAEWEGERMHRESHMTGPFWEHFGRGNGESMSQITCWRESHFP